MQSSKPVSDWANSIDNRIEKEAGEGRKGSSPARKDGNLWEKGKGPEHRVLPPPSEDSPAPPKGSNQVQTNPRMSSDHLCLLRVETVDQERGQWRRFHYGHRPQFAEFTLLSSQECSAIAFLIHQLCELLMRLPAVHAQQFVTAPDLPALLPSLVMRESRFANRRLPIGNLLLRCIPRRLCHVELLQRPRRILHGVVAGAVRIVQKRDAAQGSRNQARPAAIQFQANEFFTQGELECRLFRLTQTSASLHWAAAQPGRLCFLLRNHEQPVWAGDRIG